MKFHRLLAIVLGSVYMVVSLIAVLKNMYWILLILLPISFLCFYFAVEDAVVYREVSV